MLPFRLLRRSPFLSAVAITSLALGIGANITVYSIVRELILDDVTARQPNRLAYINADVSPSLYRPGSSVRAATSSTHLGASTLSPDASTPSMMRAMMSLWSAILSGALEWAPILPPSANRSS